MSPAGPAEVVPVAAPASLEGALGEGETVILAIKPSGWFVMLLALPRLLLAVVAAVGVFLADKTWDLSLPRRMIVLGLLLAGCAIVLWACLQWLARLYVLTDRRLLHIRGIRVVLIVECPLRAVRQVLPSARFDERMLGIGTLWFRCDGSQSEPDIAWVHINHLREIAEIVSEAVRRTR